MKNINNEYEKWVKAPQLFSVEETTIIQMYQNHVLGADGMGYGDTMAYTDAFELILNLITHNK